MICELPVARVTLRITNVTGGSSVVTLNSTGTPWAERGPQGFLFSYQLCPHRLAT